MRRFGKNVIRHLPRDLQVSPDRIEALLKGYLHTAAIYGLTLSDAIFFDDSPDIRIDQYPLIRSIYSKQPRSKHVNEFYDMLSEATEARRAMRELYRQNEFALGNQQAVSQEQIEFGLLSRTAKGLQTLTSLQQRTADAAGKEGLKPIIAQLTRMDISGKAKFAIASEKDVGALKREIIDAISDLKASIAKGAIERAGKLREKRPEIVPRIMRSLPVPPRRDGAVTAPREGLLQ
jgi:hypothetical protein